MPLLIKHIVNTIEPREVEATREVKWEGKPIGEYAPRDATACICNGETLGKDRWHLIPPDDVELCFVEQEGLTVIPTLAALANVITTIALTLDSLQYLQETFLSPDTGSGLNTDRFGKDGAKNPGVVAFGFDRPGNTIGNRTPIQIVYGEVQVAGQFLSIHRYAESATKSQVLQFVVALCDGEITGIGGADVPTGVVLKTSDFDNTSSSGSPPVPTGVLLNDKELTEYADVRVSGRMGKLGQSIMPASNEFIGAIPFSSNIIEYEQDFTFAQGRTFSYLTKGLTRGLHVNFAFPAGLRSVDEESGDLILQNVTFQITVIRNSDSATVKSYSITLTDQQARSFYHTEYIYELTNSAGTGPDPEGYELQITRTSPSADPGSVGSDPKEQYETRLQSVCEVEPGEVPYSGVACIGLTIRASNQLSGSIPTFRALVRGRKLLQWDGSNWQYAYSNNPAWVILDLLVNDRYGLGEYITLDDINAQSFLDAANYCDVMVPETTGSATMVKRHVFNGVFSDPKSAWQQILRVCEMSRLRLIKVGNNVRLSIDNVRSAYQVFNDANILRDSDGSSSLQVGYLSKANRPTSVKLNFLSDDLWENDSVTADFPETQALPLSDDPVTIDAFGITDKAQALRHAYYLLRGNRYPFKTFELRTSMEGLVVQPGDVIRIDSDLPEWATSGRILAEPTPSSLQLDKSITFDSTKVYRLIERDNFGNIAETSFTHTGTTDTIPVSAAHAGGPVGHAYVVTRVETKPNKFIVTNISNAQGIGEKVIRGIEYVPLVFTDDSGPTDDGLFASPPEALPADATSVSISEAVKSPFEADVSEITVGWTAGSGAVDHEIYFKLLSQNGGFIFAGTSTTSPFTFEVRAPWGMKIQVAVVGINSQGGRKRPESVASTATAKHTINRDDENEQIAVFPDAATNLALTLDSDNVYDLSWTAGSGADGYEIKKNNWHGGKLIGETTGTSFAGIKVQNIIEAIAVRAYKTVGGVRYYSKEFPKVLTTPATPGSAYTTTRVDFPGGEDLWSNGILTGGVRSPVSEGYFGEGIVQDDPERSMRFITNVQDAGAIREHLISYEARVTSAILKQLGAYFWPMEHHSATGEIHKEYIETTIQLHYSNVNNFGNSFPLPYGIIQLSDLTNQDVIVTGRYFRLLVDAKLKTEYRTKTSGVRAVMTLVRFQVDSA